MTGQLGEWIDVAPGVWRLVAQPEHVNIGLVVGRSGALLIDTGAWPEQGREIRERASEIADVTHVVVTHRHYDHFFGLSAFSDLASIGHASLAQDLQDPEVLEEAFELRLDPAELALPTQLINLATSVDLGGLRAEIVHFGPGHTAGDVVVIVPGREVVFAGDLIESLDPPQFGPESSIESWPSALDGILGVLGADAVVVPGHGDPVDRMYAFDQRGRIAGLFAQATDLVSRGISEADAIHAVEWPFPEATVSAALPLMYEELARKGLVLREHLPLFPK